MRAVGKGVNRLGGRERVMGSQIYVGDVKVPGMLHARIVTIDCARGRIDSIDSDAACRVPEVRRIFTADDFMDAPRFGPHFQDRPVLAMGETKFHGEPVALVVADTIPAAEEAADLVNVVYTSLTAVTSVAEALAPEAPLVQSPKLRSGSPHAESNILDEYTFGWGSTNESEADEVIENTYTFPMVNHFAIEPFTWVAEPTKDGVTVYSSIQNPYQLQRIISGVTGLPLSRVRIMAPDPGGAFGGKQHPKHEPLLALAAMKMGVPLRLALSLAESFQTVRRTAAEIKIRSGFKSDGRLVFQDILSDYLAGAYGDIAGRVVSKGNYIGAGPYRTPSVRIKARALLSHTLPSTAFRGFGIPQINWALESQMDAAAGCLDLDRMNIRLINLPRKGETFMPQDPACDGEWSQVLTTAAEALGWGTPLPAGRGRGLTLGIKMGATTASSYALIRLHMDGSVTIFAGTSDMGQGARTIFSQMVSEELGVDMNKITVVMGDTSAVPFDLQTSASRSTVFMGNALRAACAEIRAKVKKCAAEYLEISEERISVEPGRVVFPDGEMELEEILTRRFTPVKGEILGLGESRSEYIKDHPLGGQPAFYEFVALGTELEVDQATGETVIHKMVIAGDVGRAINPQQVAMQDEGAAVMGIGHSVMEQMIFDEGGRLLNAGALDYRIPTIKDVPGEMISLHIENHDGPGPYGAKGCSESGILTVAPSIAAAVEEAAGVRIQTLPLTPERIWNEINQYKENN